MKCVLLLLFTVLTIQNGTTAQSATANGTLAALVTARSTSSESEETSLSMFRDALVHTKLFDEVLGNTSRSYTVFAPTNQAILNSPILQLYLRGSNDTTVLPTWHRHLLITLRHHIVPDFVFNNTELFSGQRVEIMSFQEQLNISQFQGTIQGSTLLQSDLFATNGILHVVNKVLPTRFFNESFAQLELQPEYGPDHLDRTAMTDVVDFVGARDLLSQVHPDGLTFVGCRIRAFNRLEEYLPQTISGTTQGVIKGEFLNETYKEITTRNFIEYSLIPKNYYSPDIPNGFMELTIPTSNCGHMWVTKRDGLLCFNNGCVVETPDPREFVASNGMGYVIDKCQVCPGVAMLTNVAAEYTTYNVKDTAQFFGASEWNLRDLRLSVGDGNNVTLFASITTGWSFFNLEDMTRLAGDEWKPHQLNLLSHMLVQGAYTQEALKTRFDTEGSYNLTSLANQTLVIDYEASKSAMTVNGAEVIFGDLQGVDGYVHFITQVPLPISVTHTVYDIAKEDPQFSTHVSYIDTVRLDADMKRLLPLTTLFAPNDAFEGKVTKMEEIADKVLKNHIFEKLLWCDTILEIAASNSSNFTSLNGQTWNVSKGSNGLPCFDTYADVGGKVKRACIKKCDILARNGIVHELDDILLYDPSETRPPSAFGDNFPTENTPVAPAAPTIFQRPSDSSLTGDDASSPEASPTDEIASGAGEQSNALQLQSSWAGTIAAVTVCVTIMNVIRA